MPSFEHFISLEVTNKAKVAVSVRCYRFSNSTISKTTGLISSSNVLTDNLQFVKGHWKLIFCIFFHFIRLLQLSKKAKSWYFFWPSDSVFSKCANSLSLIKFSINFVPISEKKSIKCFWFSSFSWIFGRLKLWKSANSEDFSLGSNSKFSNIID